MDLFFFECLFLYLRKKIPVAVVLDPKGSVDTGLIIG